MELTPTQRLALAHTVRDEAFTIFSGGASPVATDQRKITIDEALKAVDVCVAEFSKNDSLKSLYPKYIEGLVKITEGSDQETASAAIAELQRQFPVLLDLGKKVEAMLCGSEDAKGSKS